MNQNLSQQQFESVPLDRISRFPIPHEDDGSDWAAEHQDEYARHGGSAGYVQHLAQSIKRNGLRQPVELRRNGDYYDVDDGNHRIAAAHAAGETHVRARIL